MVNGVSSTGTITSQLYTQYHEGWQKNFSDIPFALYLQMMGVDMNEFSQGIENYMETGSAWKSDGVEGNTISNKRTVGNAATNQQMYQSEDGEDYYEIDWTTGTYEFFRGKDNAARRLGIDTDQYNVDAIQLGTSTAKVIDATFNAEGLSDGQQATKYDVQGAYNMVNYTVQEFDPCYLFDEELQNPNDPEYQKALQTWNTLVQTAGQWMTEEDLEYINSFEVGTAEYNEALRDIILGRLDQPQEYGEHDHVEFESEMAEITESESTGATDGTGSTTGNETITAPVYDRTDVMMKSSISSDYLAGVCRVGTRTKNTDDAHAEAINMAMADLNAAASALYTRLSESGTLTEQAAANINQAVANTVEYLSNKDNTYRYHADGGDYRISDDKIGYGYRAGRKKYRENIKPTYNVKEVVNHFFNEFDTLTYQGTNSASSSTTTGGGTTGEETPEEEQQQAS